MSASWIQDRRRKQAAGYDEKTGAALSDIMGGLEASLAVPETERKRKLAEETAAGELGAKKSVAEATLLRAKTADKAAEESLLRKKGEGEARTARDEAKKAADDAKMKAEGAKGAESVLRKRAASGADIETLIGAASADENLGEMDDDAVRGIQAEELAKKEGATAKVDADKALADARTADAEKKRRAPTGGKGAKPVDPEIAAAKKRSVLAQAKKDEADAKKAERDAAGDGKPVKPLLTPGEVTSVTELQQGQDILNRLKTMKTTGGDGGAPIDTGPLAAAQSWFATKLGVADPKRAEFKALAGENIASYIKSISGATVSEPERANLLNNVPGPADNDELFLAKLKTVKDTLDAKLRIQKKAFAATGRDTTIFDVPDDVGAVPPAKKPADMSDADIEARLKELKAKR